MTHSALFPLRRMRLNAFRESWSTVAVWLCALLALATSCAPSGTMAPKRLAIVDYVREAGISFELLESSTVCKWNDHILFVPRAIRSPESIRGFLFDTSSVTRPSAAREVSVVLPDSVDSRYRVEACAFAYNRLFLLIGMNLYVCRSRDANEELALVCDTAIFLGRKYTSVMASESHLFLVSELFVRDDTTETIAVTRIGLPSMNREWERQSRAIDGYPLLLFQPRRIATILPTAVVIADIDRYRLRLYDDEMRLESEAELSIAGWGDHGADIRRTVRNSRNSPVKSLIDSLRRIAYGTWSIRRVDALNDTLLLVTMQTPFRVKTGVMEGKPELRYDVWVKRKRSLLPVVLDFRTSSPTEDQAVSVVREWPLGEGFATVANRIMVVAPCVSNQDLSGTYGELIKSVRTRVLREADPPGSLLFMSIDDHTWFP